MKQLLQAVRRPATSARARRMREDAVLLKEVAAWLLETAELTEATLEDGADRCVFPPCMQCGGDVDGFLTEGRGRTLIQFLPCRCRVVLSQRARGRRVVVES